MTVGTGWDAWVFGDLTFPSGALDKWKKARVSPADWESVPAWLAPTLAADTTPTRIAQDMKWWEPSLSRYIGTPDVASLSLVDGSASFRAYLTAPWFQHFAGELFAAALSAAHFGASGTVVFSDVVTAKGWTLRLGDGAPRLEPIDWTGPVDPALATLGEDAHEWALRKAKTTLPPIGTPQPTRTPKAITDAHRDAALVTFTGPPRSFVVDHVAAGGIWDGGDTLGMPRCYPEGTEREIARVRARCGVIDATDASHVKVSYDGARDLVATLAPGWSGAGPAEIDLFDPESKRFVDRALVLPGAHSLVLLGSAVDRGYLHGWLRNQAAARRPAPTIEMGTMWGGGLVFVGPDACAVAAEVAEAPALATLGEGESAANIGLAGSAVRVTRAGLPTLWLWPRPGGEGAPAYRAVGERCRALFVGTDAARTLEHDAGLTPRPTWRAMHCAPWSDPAPLTLQLATPAPTAKKKASKKAAS